MLALVSGLGAAGRCWGARLLWGTGCARASSSPATPPTPLLLRSPAGSFASGDGSQECNACEPGTISAAGASECTACGAGKFTVNEDGAGAEECQDCPAGTYKTAEAKDNKCQSCPAGYFTGAQAAASSCSPCPKGQFASNPNTVTCKACAPGAYAEAEGSRFCKLCAAGSVSEADATTALTANADGSYGNTGLTGGAKCLLCPRRTFRPSVYSANVCTVCPAGRETKADEGASVCTACTPGFSLLDASGQANINCTACGAGARRGWLGLPCLCSCCPAPAQLQPLPSLQHPARLLLTAAAPPRPAPTPYRHLLRGAWPRRRMPRVPQGHVCVRLGQPAVRHLPAGHLPGQRGQDRVH